MWMPLLTSLSSLGLISAYAYIARQAWGLAQIPLSSPGWRRAWYGVISLVGLLGVRRVGLAIEPWVPVTTGLWVHPTFIWSIATLTAIVLIGLTRELGRIFTQPLGSLEQPMPVVVSNTRGEIVFWNACATLVFGYQVADVIGRPVADVLVPPDLRDAHIAGVARAAREGLTAFQGRPYVTRALCADGREIPVEIRIMLIEEYGFKRFLAMIRPL